MMEKPWPEFESPSPISSLLLHPHLPYLFFKKSQNITQHKEHVLKCAPPSSVPPDTQPAARGHRRHHFALCFE